MDRALRFTGLTTGALHSVVTSNMMKSPRGRGLELQKEGMKREKILLGLMVAHHARGKSKILVENRGETKQED